MLICFPADALCVIQEIQPVIAFIAFFQSNFQLGNEVTTPLGELCFMNVGTDRGAASKKLVQQDGFYMFFPQIPGRKNDVFCKTG